MTKKSRRARKKAARSVSKAAVSAAPAVEAEAAVEPAADRQEYAYVVADIRQVAILAGAVFVLLVALSFFIG